MCLRSPVHSRPTETHLPSGVSVDTFLSVHSVSASLDAAVWCIDVAWAGFRKVFHSPFRHFECETLWLPYQVLQIIGVITLWWLMVVGAFIFLCENIPRVCEKHLD